MRCIAFLPALVIGAALALQACSDDTSSEWVASNPDAGIGSHDAANTGGAASDASGSTGGASGKAGSSGAAGGSAHGGSAGNSQGGGAGEAGSSQGGSPGTGGSSNLPSCDCYYGDGLYCGAGVSEEAAKKGCKVDILPAQDKDVLRCTGGSWTVELSCSEGCVVAPPGENDYCKASVSPDGYMLPWACGAAYQVTQGNNSAFSHSGTMAYAWDFGLPRHTAVHASRGGTVVFSQNLVGPGDACYDGCSTDACCNNCLNTVNRVVIDHGDGTNAAYLHLDEATIAQGATVKRGDMLGWSGISGCSFGAHLHFQVQQDCGIWFCSSVQMQFSEDPGLGEGDTPTSQNCP